MNIFQSIRFLTMLLLMFGVCLHTQTLPAQTASKYYCPMDQEVRSDVPGICPVCGMKLLKRDALPKKLPAYRLSKKIVFPKSITDGYDIAVTIAPLAKPDSNADHVVDVRVRDTRTHKRITDADCWFHIVHPDGKNLMPHLELVGDRYSARLDLSQKGAYTFMAHVNMEENVTRVIEVRLY